LECDERVSFIDAIRTCFKCTVAIHKEIKKFVKETGVNAALKFIKETLFNPWLTDEWFDQLHKQKPQLRFLME